MSCKEWIGKLVRAALKGFSYTTIILLAIFVIGDEQRVIDVSFFKVIGFGMLIFVAFEIEALFKYASTRRELSNEGNVLIDNAVQLKYRKKSRTGWLFLRVEGLTFVHKKWLGYFERIDIKQDDIVSFETRSGFDGYGVLPRYIRVKTRNGEIYDVYVDHRQKWIEAFELIRHPV